jgi:alpha-tubulin suppressor-like RCC1 family protein
LLDLPVGPAIVTGERHTCTLHETGEVWCWGNNSTGALGDRFRLLIGDDELPSSRPPVPIDGLVVQLSAGRQHTCATMTDGALRCWGLASEGQLGYGNTHNIGDNEDPAAAGKVNLGDTVESAAAGWAHTCAILSSGALRCWGAGSLGRLGLGVSARADRRHELPSSVPFVPVY